ncbi:MAG: gamma-glutamylcyclotransferase family protein [Sphingobacteriales bacterium]|jgi:hypothetical protein
MITYFGYGSNINLISLRAKGVVPLSSLRGTLKGWKLAFNVQHWFRHEGGVGNIIPTSNEIDRVEGLVHQFPDEHLASLDAMEAYGIGYDRILVDVETQNGPKRAYTYIGLPGHINDACLPSRRYLNIILRGAETAGLDNVYVERLRNHPVHEPENYPVFEYPHENGEVYDRQSLAEHLYLTALAGAVFDMRGSRKQLEPLLGLFGGKDMTLFHVKRLDSSDGSETMEDIQQGNISEAAKNYLNAYLWEYSREFSYAGRFENS